MRRLVAGNQSHRDIDTAADRESKDMVDGGARGEDCGTPMAKGGQSCPVRRLTGDYWLAVGASALMEPSKD
jgi:hypothetical protein